MKKYNIAIIGATGNVGREVLNIIDERNFPVNEIFALASKNSEAFVINLEMFSRVNYNLFLKINLYYLFSH